MEKPEKTRRGDAKVQNEMTDAAEIEVESPPPVTGTEAVNGTVTRLVKKTEPKPEVKRTA